MSLEEISTSTTGVQTGFNGPLSGPMWNQVSSLGSSYSDQFSWDIYDFVHLKHVDNPPKLGPTFKTGIKIVNHHSTCSKCHYSLVIDTYGRGCTHNCAFCYAKEMLSKYGAWNSPHPFPLDLTQIRKIFHRVFETDKRGKWRDVLSKRIPLRIGSMSDAFMPMERKYGITKELLKILRHYRYPYIVFTRGVLAADDDYIDVMDRDLAVIQFSICGDNEEMTKKLEPGSPSVQARLHAVGKIAKSGIRTAVRIHPLFPTYPDGYFTSRSEVIERFGGESAVPHFDLCHIRKAGSFLRQIKDAGVPTVLVGFGYFTDSALKQVRLATGINFKDFFLPERQKGHGAKHYTPDEITIYYKMLHSEAEKIGLRFTTCFVGHGPEDYYRNQHLWSNKRDCCDVIGNVQGFRASSQEIPWTFRIKQAPCKADAMAAKATEEKMDFIYARNSEHSKRRSTPHIGNLPAPSLPT